MYIRSILNLSHLPHHPTPLGCHRALDSCSLHHKTNFHQLSNFTYGNVYVAMPLSQFAPPSTPCVHQSVQYVCISINSPFLSRHHLSTLRMANKCMKRCSTSQIIREMQIKIKMSYHFISVRMAIIKKKINRKQQAFVRI